MTDPQTQPAPENVEIMVEFTCQLDIDEFGSKEWMQDLMVELLKQDENGQPSRLAPAIVYSDCPYANYVEFGTPPGMEKPSGSEDERMKKMEQWVAQRLGHNEGPRKHKFALWLKNYVETKGIAPSPYMRSAVDVVLSRHCPGGSGGNATEFLDNGGTLLQMAEEIRDVAKSTIEHNGMNISGSLRDSIHAEPIDSWTIVDGRVEVGATDTDPTVTDAMWKDSRTGRAGKKPTRYWKDPGA